MNSEDQGENRSGGAAPLSTFLCCLALVVGVLAIYAQTFSHGFAALDDAQYVTDNPVIRDGLTIPGLWLAFAPEYASNWHPLTWISLMLDVELCGFNPSGYHVVNTLLHAANAVLLFLWLRLLPGRVSLWAALIAAAFWAWHPLRVESVAWISQRKDVLSAFWALLALCLHARTLAPTARRPAPAPGAEVGRDLQARPCAAQVAPAAPSPQSETVLPAALVQDLAIWICFALALMSKQTVIMLPVLLVLLELVVVKRIAWQRLAPLFAFAAAAGFLTVIAQKEGGAMASIVVFPFWARVVNAGLAIGVYLRQTLWPSGLTIFYPCRPFAVWEVATGLATWLGVGVALSVACGLAVWEARVKAAKGPSGNRAAVVAWHGVLLLGLGWFLLSLLPVLGLVQVGGQAHADRYTYWPAIGLAVLAWHGLSVRSRLRAGSPCHVGVHRWQSVLVVVLLGALLVQAHRQTSRWRSTEVLFRHALEVTDANSVAHDFLGLALWEQGRTREGLRHLLIAAELLPNARHYYHAGSALLDSGRTNDARQVASRALAEFPADPLVRTLAARLWGSVRQE